MLSLYIGAFSLGGLLIAASVFMGGSDADADFDVDVDQGLDFDMDPELLEGPQAGEGMSWWLPFLSMRFWTFALASFGGAGALLSLLETSAPLTFGISTSLGLAMGWSVAWMFHQLKKTRTVGELTTRSMQGAEATVMLEIGPEKRGKIRLLFEGSTVEIFGQTEDNIIIARGSKVLVVSVVEGVAQVTKLRPRDPAHRVNKSETERRVVRPEQES